MATTTRPTTDAPTLPTNTHPWPAFDRDHDPDYLVTNDPTETKRTTLADFGGVEPTAPDRATIPVDDRETTRQTSVFEYPREWWTDRDRLAHLFDERGLSIAAISDLFGADRCYEVVRTQLNELGVRDPDAERSLSELTEATNPEELGLSPMQSDDSHAKFTKRGERA